MVLLLVVAVLAGFLGSRLPGGFLPEEDQGYFYLNVQLPTAASLQRTDEVAKKIEAHPEGDAGRSRCTTRSSASACSASRTRPTTRSISSR